jgi:hypothetical protein
LLINYALDRWKVQRHIGLTGTPTKKGTKTMSLQINDVAPAFDGTHFEEVRPDLLDLVQGTTACSSTVFYGLLAWANLDRSRPSR